MSQISSNQLLMTKHDRMDYIKEIFSKDYGVDTSEYQKHKEDLIKQGKEAIFVDEQFPPTRESLCQNWEDITDKSVSNSWSQIQWLRPKEFLKLQQGEKIKLFDKIEPADIQQGLLGDCYFLSSLSSLAEREQLIKRLFETKTYQENGLYGIWLNIDGEWKCILIDDHIPCKHGKPAFTRANGNELWVLLLEKAYAKAYGSYYKIEGGNPAVALRDLTGAPYSNFDEKDPDKMFEFLELHDDKGNGDILTCYTTVSDQREAKNDAGLYSGHAYSILDVKRIESKDKKQHHILQVRNPWGKGEWQGDWSDNDTKNWNDYTMKQVPTFQRAEDGSFWIGIQDFCQYFEGVGACQLQDEAKYNSIAFRLPQNSTQAIIKLNLLQNCKKCTVSICQKDQRHYNNDESKYKYSFATFVMVKKEGNHLKWVGGAFDVERNMMIISQDLPKGEYYLLVEMMWSQDHHRNLVVSSYSDQDTTFAFVKQGLDFNKCLEQAIKSYCLQNTQIITTNQKIKINKYNGDQIGRINGSDFGLLFYYFYNHSWNTSLYQKLTFSKLTGYALPEGYTDKDNIEIAIPPQKEQVFILKFNAIKDFKTEYSFKSSMQMMNKDQCPYTPNQKVFLEDLWTSKYEEEKNIEAKDRNLVSTNFRLGMQSVDQSETAVTVLKCEVVLIDTLVNLIAPFIQDWPLYLFRLTLLYGFFLLLFSFDNCNFFDMVLIMVCFVLFQCQVMTRKRMRRILICYLVSIASSVIWFILFPNKWNSVDSQFDKLHKAWTYLIPLLELVFISVKVYICLIYWKAFVNYDQMIKDVYQRFSIDSKKEIIGV